MPGTMTDLDLAALLISRVCHDLVSPVGAIVNGLEVLEDERDPVMRADALKLVASSAEQAAARLQFARVAFGAAGSTGAELDLTEIGRNVEGLLKGRKVELEWRAASLNWPKDWAKLLMNATLLIADSLPRGGKVHVATNGDAVEPSFRITGTGHGARVLDEVAQAARGDVSGGIDGRTIQPYLTHKLAQALDTQIALRAGETEIEISAG